MNKKEFIEYWIEKAYKSYETALLMLENNTLDFAVNRLYYSMFYIISAYFFSQGKSFKKHSGIKANFNKELIKTKKLPVKYGTLLDILFEARHQADYSFIFEIKLEDIHKWEKEVNEFLKIMEKLIREELKNDNK